MIVQRYVEMIKEDPQIIAALKGGVFPVEWPDAPTFPLAIVQRGTGRGETDFQGEAGIEEARVQIDVYATGYEEMSRIALMIRRKFHGFSGGPIAAPCVINRSACINNSDLPVSDSERAGPRLRRRMLEFSVWNKEI